jgi:hypothetical protein
MNDLYHVAALPEEPGVQRCSRCHLVLMERRGPIVPVWFEEGEDVRLGEFGAVAGKNDASRARAYCKPIARTA